MFDLRGHKINHAVAGRGEEINVRSNELIAAGNVELALARGFEFRFSKTEANRVSARGQVRHGHGEIRAEDSIDKGLAVVSRRALNHSAAAGIAVKKIS